MQAQAQFTIHSLNDVVASTTAPSSPYKGQLWVNTSYSPPRTFVYNGSAWKEQNGTDTLRSNISTLTTKSNTMQSSLDGLTSTVSSVTTRVETVEDDLGVVEENILDIQTDVSELEQTASSIALRVTQNETSISSLSVDVTGLKTRVTNAEGNISTLVQTTTSLSASVSSKLSATGGSSSSFGWSLTSSGFYLYANDNTVMEVTESSMYFYGDVYATGGELSYLTVTGRLYFGGNDQYYIDPNYDDGSYYIYLPGLRVDDASGAVFSGRLSAPSGTIGGFTISTSAIYKTKTSYSSTTSGVYIGTTGIGLGAGTFYVTSAGALYCTSGTIGGFTITSSAVYKTKIAYSNSTAGVYLGTDGIGLGAGTFYVTSAGALYASSATITGTVNATGGTFQNVEIRGSIYFNEDREYYINPNYNNGSWYIYLPNFRVDDTSAYFSGTLQAPSGTIGGFTISTNKIYKTKTSYSSSSSGVYIGTDGIGLGAGTFYVTSAGALTASNVNITGGSIKLGSSTGNMYTKVDSSGIQCGGLSWARFTLAYSSLHLYANQWGDDTCINDICVGWFGGYDTGISLYGINATCADEDFYVYATRSTDYYTTVGFYMRARKGVTCKGHFLGTWTTYSAISVTSDENDKNSIEPLSNKYSVMFDNLAPKRFRYNEGNSGRYHIGFIAQQVKDSLLAAELSTSEFAGLCIAKTDDGEEWSLRYEEFIAMNTMEIQKLKKRVAELEARLG